jgi:hypothetical protein
VVHVWINQDGCHLSFLCTLFNEISHNGYLCSCN